MAMGKSKIKKFSISPERLAELRRATLIASTGSSLRLSGPKITNEQIEQILNAISKHPEQK